MGKRILQRLTWTAAPLLSLMLLALGSASTIAQQASPHEPAVQPQAVEPAVEPEATLGGPDESREDNADVEAMPRSLLMLKAIEQKTEAAVTAAMPATVALRVNGGQGSGVVISEDGYVLTAGHVSGKPGRSVTFVFADGSRAKGRTLGNIPDVDAGLAKITDQGPWPYVPMGDSAGLTAGQWTVALGHPGGFRRDRPPVVRNGRLILSTQRVIWSDCVLVGGDSGGPLLDLAGNVSGIHSRIGRRTFNNFHVPVNVYREKWDDLVAGKVIAPPARAFLGIGGADHDDGVRVTRIMEGGAADKAKLRIGDIITHIDEKPTPNLRTLAALIEAHKPGDKVTLTHRRGDDKLTSKATLGQRAGGSAR